MSAPKAHWFIAVLPDGGANPPRFISRSGKLTDDLGDVAIYGRDDLAGQAGIVERLEKQFGLKLFVVPSEG